MTKDKRNYVVDDHPRIKNFDKLSREDLIKEYGGGPHSTFGIGNTEIKRYKADPYNGYLPTFNIHFNILIVNY